MDQLNTPQYEILRLIHLYIEEHDGNPPYRNNVWFLDRTGYPGNYITNIKGELKRLRYVDENLRLTKKGENYVRAFFNPLAIQGVKVFVQGSVTAGPSDYALVNMDVLDKPSEHWIVIPNTSLVGSSFAVEVKGASMQALGILEGDFLIVERRDTDWWPDSSDMIIARYLPHNPSRPWGDVPDPTEYVGPVVKVFLEKRGKKGCVLGWTTSNELNIHQFEADELIPIAKVIGVYRDYARAPKAKPWLLSIPGVSS